MGFFDLFKKKKDEGKTKAGSSVKAEKNPLPLSKAEAAPEYELDDITYIRKLSCIQCGVWKQYDVLLAAAGYGWENMKQWAEYMKENDLDVSHGTLTASPIIGSSTETELIESLHTVGDICRMPELEAEQGVLAIGGISKVLKAPVKLVLMNQTQYIRLFSVVTDEGLMRRYIETVIRRSFGTPDAMKLAKPLPENM